MPLTHPMDGVDALTNDPRFHIARLEPGHYPGWASKAVFPGRTYTITVLASRTPHGSSRLTLAAADTGEIIERHAGPLDEMCARAVATVERYEDNGR